MNKIREILDDHLHLGHELCDDSCPEGRKVEEAIKEIQAHFRTLVEESKPEKNFDHRVCDCGFNGFISGGYEHRKDCDCLCHSLHGGIKEGYRQALDEYEKKLLNELKK